MPRRSPPALSIVAVTLAILAMGVAATGRGAPALQDPAAAPGGEKPGLNPALKPFWYSATQCRNCHRPDNGQPITDFVQLEEFDKWLNLDKHSKAFESLDISKNSTSKRMGELLQIEVAKDARCLNCHAPAAAAKEKDDLAVSEGVSCSACHGAYDVWTTEHGRGLSKQEAWIKKTAAEKHDQYGMTDLRNPTVRTQVCASCHIGDVRENRVVTHEMYAAGHPPLPGLEVATFSQAEPPHWWPLSQVPYLKRAPVEVQRIYHYEQAGTQQAKLVAIGGVVAFREAMKLFAETGAPDKSPFDFARFDCASCHHELKVSDQSWRQARGFAADPGRPPAPDWPAALVSLGIEAGDPSKAKGRTQVLADKLKVYHAAVGKTPFGDTSASIAAARGLMTWSDALILELETTKLDRNAALRMLRQITTIEPPDHASARQLAWGFRNIYNELSPRPANDSQVVATLNQLTEMLGINLTPGNTLGTVEREVGARLDADEKFNPAAVGQLFETLGALLP